jgi:hypothetical protein
VLREALNIQNYRFVDKTINIFLFILLLLFSLTLGCRSFGDFPKVSRSFGVAVFSKTATPFVSALPNSTYELYKDEKNKKLCEDALLSALSIYPPEIISSNLNFIVLLEKLTSGGIEYGGTYVIQKPRSTGVYIIVPKHLSGHEITRNIIETFHHEFSSVLLDKQKNLTDAWLKSNAKAFEYTYKDNQGGYYALKNKHFKGITLFELNEQGILSHYGASSLEEDFNTYAQDILSNPKEFKLKYKKFPIIKKKTQIFLDFYLSLSPEFKKSEPFTVLKNWI